MTCHPINNIPNMNKEEAARLWNDNAEAWTVLVRAGYDLYRDLLNTPGFFQILPNINGLYGLDIGCGEGYNTRLLAAKGARLDAIDVSEIFIQKAQEEEQAHPAGIRYQVADAQHLPYEAGQFDFATAFMSLMDVPEPETAIQEAFRVLKPGGFLQFSISHPCFSTPHRRNLRNAQGETYAIEVGGYFQNVNGEWVEEWIFGAAPEALKGQFPKFKVPRFIRTLSQWMNYLLHAGFIIEQVHEPCPSDETIQQYPYLQDSSVTAYFLQIRCRKPL
jgi:ubiquinone/menaquinone biosynthesis C-methylase UbiE